MANNLGIRATASSQILLLNTDTVVPPGTIERLVGALRERPDVAVIGPRLLDADGRPEISFGRLITPCNELRQKVLTRLYGARVPGVTGWVHRKVSRVCFPEWVSGACLLVRREDAEAVGLLDERYFLYAEDVDFCAAIRSRGRLVMFTPEVEIVHLRGRSVAAAPAASERLYRMSQLAFYGKHHPAWLHVIAQLPQHPATKCGLARPNVPRQLHEPLRSRTRKGGDCKPPGAWNYRTETAGSASGRTAVP